MIPEHLARIEEIETIKAWMKTLERHAPSKRKWLIMELRQEGHMSHEVARSLFTAFNLSGA